MRSKLFNPKLYQKTPGNVLDRTETPDCFVNVPTHPNVPMSDNSTEKMGMGYGLSMSQKDQSFAKTPQCRKFVVKTDKHDYEY